jgi:hypothetical protein
MNPDDMIEKLSGAMSLRRRIGYLLVLLGGLGGALTTGLLWATEPGLPARTSVAFAALTLIGLAWAGYGGWALTRRAPLLALDRVIAGWLALAATGLLSAVFVAITLLRQRLEPALLVTASTLLVLAAANLLRARGHRAALLRRKRELGG